MTKFKTWLLSKYFLVISSIAFYPALISFGFMLSAFVLLAIEDSEMTKFLLENLPFLVIDNADTARSILTTLIGGIISLTVFSFSMVMVLLNQASNSFSPRLLPGLISDKRHQIVLGFYIGTIIFNIIVVISILPSGETYTIQGFSILIGIVLGIMCLALFVFFIHSISTGIQINSILDEIYTDTKKHLLDLIEESSNNTKAATSAIDKSYKVFGDKTGYFQGVNMEALKTFVKSNNQSITITPFKGKYLLPGEIIYISEKPIDEDGKNTLLDIIFYSGESGTTGNFVFGINQISEVGIKAMSPGINDPGTAIMTIDYITELLALRMRLKDVDSHCLEDTSLRIDQSMVRFEELLSDIMAPYRLYCKHDVILMTKLTNMLKYLLNQSSDNQNYIDAVKSEIQNLQLDVEEGISNPNDRSKLVEKIESIEGIS